MSYNNILITGINGFVGSILRRSLEVKGYHVFGMDTESRDTAVRQTDITNLPAVMKCMEELSPDFVFHLAAISRVDSVDPSLLYAINVNGTMNLLSAAVSMKKKPGFLLVSSSQVYGIVDASLQPITEDTPLRPVNHYGASKASAEHIANVFRIEHGLPLVIVRPFNHTGRGQNPHFIIPKIVSAVREKKQGLELGNLSVIRDFMDVRDVTDAYIRLMERLPDGEIFNVASGTGYRLSDLLTMIQELSKTTLDIKHSDSLLRKNEIIKAIGDSSALQQCLNWRPAYSIRDTLEWLLTE
ncbi:MAG TPA: GDP-mannose 4,6-dehydratase [Spirochaetota bacterium]|nr:GDP-mannose 4,6-dehydratase [Spirochaetota bacterium]HOD13427.1 GDP-mannose 4,6-dehydratase [Spirochaetota bacterium]HPG49376.1 GDP-mannose 4,6-dehydratase [Spirochaetota bacterium]HPN10607.1 GDP-mannose 4,6-dehydratase [Spirochaetota bacterium]HQL81503.1 GDP-mannose 4,6-dehydratase [Spirochaetota bacterium]